MDPAIIAYFTQMGLSPDLKDRVEALLHMFENATGHPAQNALLTPQRDFIGNPCFEFWMFNDNALMNTGMLVKKAPTPRYDLVSLRGRVTHCLLTAKGFDPANGDQAVADDHSEFGAEIGIWGRAKNLELSVKGRGCTHLNMLVQRHIMRNLA